MVVPDARDLDRLDAAVSGALGPGRHVAPQRRARSGRTVPAVPAGRRREVSCVIGTRAAAFAPVVELGLVAIWDDGDDLYAEPRAPYPHARRYC